LAISEFSLSVLIMVMVTGSLLYMGSRVFRIMFRATKAASSTMIQEASLPLRPCG
jgi:hypothetical protein